MKYNFKAKLDNVKVVSAGVSLILLLSSCSIGNIEMTSDSTSNSVTITTQQSFLVESSNTSQNAITTTEETSYCLEYTIQNLNGFAQYLNDNGYNIYRNNMPYYQGFDNPYLQELLDDYARSVSGETNVSVSPESMHYFQHSNQNVTEFGRVSYSNVDYFTDIINENTYSKNLSAIRGAILIENDLRFMIDEIPYSYFEQRFPEFVSNQSADYQADLINQYVELVNRIWDSNTNLLDLSNITDYEYDLLLYVVCIGYNNARTGLAYSCNINIERDSETGQNILSPNETRLEELNNTFGEFVGGDVMQVETREHFYETYGMYPEDALYRETRYEGNLTESNSMNSPAPSRQR